MLTLREVTEACGGRWSTGVENSVISGVSIDTREEQDGKLFVALKGDRFDGHDYIYDALAKGSVCVLSETEHEGIAEIVVPSTHTALRDLAEYYMSKFDVTVVAVTGSAGKTTTKDLVASVLAQRYKTLKTQGNLNNEIGLPLTIFRMDESYETAVLEMGMNHFGEIRNLSKVARPDICVITNIGEAHMENLGGRDGILRAKTEIFEYMKPDGRIFLNGKDEMLLSLKGKYENIFYYGMEDDSLSVNMSVPGAHMISNGMAAAAVGRALGLTENEIRRGIEEFRPSSNRMEIISINGLTIINDVYNANPSAMKAAIDVLAGMEGRKIGILGDMLELGDSAHVMHREIGAYAVNRGIDMLICIGPLSYHIYEGAKSGCDALHYLDKESFLSAAKNHIREGDAVLIKASRGMKFENILDYLSGNGFAESAPYTCASEV